VGSVLIFVTRKANSEELAANLRSRDFKGIVTSNNSTKVYTFEPKNLYNYI